MPLPNLLTDVARYSYTIFNGHAFDWNKRYNIGGAKPWMSSLMLIQINQLGRLADTPNHSFLNWFALAYQGDHAAVVVGIHLAVEEVHPIEFHGFNDGINFGFVPAFREIRDALHQSLHKREGYPPETGAATNRSLSQYPRPGPRDLTRLRPPTSLSRAACARLRSGHLLQKALPGT